MEITERLLLKESGHVRQTLTADGSDKALVEDVIVMAHRLGIRTAAEGVETEASGTFSSHLAVTMPRAASIRRRCRRVSSNAFC